jgi:signal transduction histidine kinase/BarA-like signal transduction histidine kinase
MMGNTEKAGHRPQKKYIRWAVFLVLSCFLLAFSAPVRAADSEGTQKQVLFINSYGYDFETVPVVMQEVSDKLKGVASIQYLFMNEKYISDEEASAELSAELDSMTTEFKYSAVILGDDAAFDFAIRNRDKYFKDIPLVYEDINSLDKAEKYKGDPLISGVVEAFPMKGTIELAQKVQKEATRVVVITDNSVSGSGSARQAMEEQADFPDLKFELFDTSKMTAQEIQKNIAAYGSDTILLYTVFNVDGSGSRYTLAQGVKLITDAAQIPVFKADEAGLGDGLIGGYMLSYQSIGQETADLVLSALKGEQSGDTNYRVGTCVYKFDEQVMDKYQVSKSNFPQDAVYINTNPSFFEANEEAIIIAVCIAAAICALILILSESRKRQLRRELELEEKSNRSKTEFISRMSHDIRTPLNAILGMDTLAYENAGDSAKVREYLEKAVASGELLTSLVNDILDISKIESGKMKLNPSRVGLKNFFDNIQSVFGNLCEEKAVELVVEENAGDVTVLTDSVRFNQLFYNLLTNAVKFTDPGGRVTFTLDAQTQDDMLHSTFAVTDTGCGISAEFQKRMFDQFSQEGKMDVQGSGLGLSIVKSITDLMGGRITVDSTLGKGSTFRVFLDLPIAEEAQDKDTGEKKGRDTSVLNGRHVLLAEDNAINALITQLMLENVGMTVDLAEDGERVVERFAQAPEGYYFLILMDNRMPGKTGMEATRAIRELAVPGAETIPIIALTADAFEDDYQKFMESGMNDCLTKPLDKDKLIAMLLKYSGDTKEQSAAQRM